MAATGGMTGVYAQQALAWLKLAHRYNPPTPTALFAGAAAYGLLTLATSFVILTLWPRRWLGRVFWSFLACAVLLTALGTATAIFTARISPSLSHHHPVTKHRSGPHPRHAGGYINISPASGPPIPVVSAFIHGLPGRHAWRFLPIGHYYIILLTIHQYTASAPTTGKPAAI